MKNGIICKFSYCVLAATAALQLANAQGTINYGSIGGQVSDPTGAVVVGAAVTARQTDTNLTSALMTDQEGRFRFPYLSVGAYEVKVQQPGFAVATADRSTLTVGSAFDLPISLAVASGGEQRHRHRRGHRAGGGAQPDRGHRLASRSAVRCR